MANILQYQQRTDPALSFHQPTPRATSQGSGWGLVADAISEVEDTLRKREEEQGRAWAIDAVSKARLEWTVEMKRRQETAEQGAPDFTAVFARDFDEYAAKALENAPTASARKFLHERLADIRVSFGEQATTFEAAARIDYRDTKFNESISNYQKLVSLDPAQFEVALSEQLAVIDASAMPPAKRADMHQKAVVGIATASIMAQINKDPKAFLDQIGLYDGSKVKDGDITGKTGNKAFDILPFDARTKLVAEALQLQNGMQASADRALERQNKEARNNIMKEALTLHYPADGGASKLTRQWVDMNRALLDDKEYESLIKMSRGEKNDGDSDPVSFREAQRLIYDDPARAKSYAFAQHASGRLSDSDLSSILSKADTLERQGGPKTVYERSRARIVGNLDPGPLVQDPVGRGRLAEALYEFDAWADSGKRTDAEIEQRAAEVIKRYRFVDTSKMLPTPLPANKPPTSPKEKALAPIGAEWNKAKADYAAKRISKEQYDAKARELNQRMKEVAQQYKDE